MVVFKPKRPLASVPFLQKTIDEVLNPETEASLLPVLEKFNSPFGFERAEERNLLHWYKVLNRFDQILKRYIEHRDALKLVPPDSTASPKPQVADTGTTQHDVSEASRAQANGPKTLVDEKRVAFVPSSILIRQVLRVTLRLIRNASHDTRTMYNSLEQLGALLADDNSAIVLLTLEVTSTLVQKSHKLRPPRTQLSKEMTGRLLDLAHGWGGRESNLGLLECCSSLNQHSLPAEGSCLLFEYSKSTEEANSSGRSAENQPNEELRSRSNSEVSAKRAISAVSQKSTYHIPLSLEDPRPPLQGDVPVASSSGSMSSILIHDVGDFRGNERWLVADFAAKEGVPRPKMFSLLSALRRAKSFSDGRDSRIEMAIVRLYAITILMQVQPLVQAANEPELLQDIVALARADKKDGVNDIPLCLRHIAIRCLTAMASDRNRFSQVVSSSGVTVHHGALPTLLRTEIATLLSNKETQKVNDRMDITSSDERAGRVERNPPGNLDSQADTIKFPIETDLIPGAVRSTIIMESLLSLVHSIAMSAGSSGATSLSSSGTLAILIPILEDTNVLHTRVVSQAIRAMQAIVEGSSHSTGCQIFRDHEGLRLVGKRITTEVEINDPSLSTEDQWKLDEEVETRALRHRLESRAFYERLGDRQMSLEEALKHPPPSSSTAARGLLPHSKWALLRALLQLLVRALGGGGAEVRELAVESKLPLALRKILAQPFLHGGSLFQSAVTVTTEIAHAEPAATGELVKNGLTATVLRTIRLGLPPCAEAVRCIPSLLAALCLAPKARTEILKAKPLKLYMLRLATPFYIRAMHGECPVMIGTSLDELMRHVEVLRPDGNDALIEYLRVSSKFVESDTKSFFKRPSPEAGSSSGKIEADRNIISPKSTEGNPRGRSSSAMEIVKPPSDGVLLDRMRLAIANNSCRLVGFAQGSAEHQEGIVDKGGLDYIVHMRLAPALAAIEASTRDGYSSRHYPAPNIAMSSLGASLRNFSSRHATPVMRSVFNVILRDATTVLKIGKDLDDLWLPEEDEEQGSHNSADGGQSTSREPGQGNNNGRLVESISTSTPNDVQKKRKLLRENMGEALKKLRVGVTLLTGLFSRGGPGTPAHVWDTAKGSSVATVISTVERAARYHLAIVYTGLTLSASGDGDLSAARVSAAADYVMEMKPISPESAKVALGNLDSIFGWSLSTDSVFKEACKKYRVPSNVYTPVRQDVEGLAWCLVTFAVASQRLYANLSKSLSFNSRRLAREPGRHASSSRSLSATIGRIFSLHLMTADLLWEKRVISMGKKQVVAAWDYVRGILIEIKGTLFDDGHRGTQVGILKAFLDAGGAEALMRATRPATIVKAAGALQLPDPCKEFENVGSLLDSQKIERLLKGKSMQTISYMLALADIVDYLEGRKSRDVRSSSAEPRRSPGSENEDVAMSSDSISHQARAISRIMVSEPENIDDRRNSSGAFEDNASCNELLEILRNEPLVNSLRSQATTFQSLALSHSSRIGVGRIASDVWSTLCQFLYLISSCPRLVSSSSSPMPESSQTGTDWEPRQVQRSSLTVALNAVRLVLKDPASLLDSFDPDASAMSDLLGIVHTTSQMAEDLSKRTASRRNGHDLEDPEMYIRSLRPSSPQPQPNVPDPEMLQSLVEMGFSERRAASALRRTAPGGLEYAAEWLLSHRDGDEDSDSAESGAEERENDWLDDEAEEPGEEDDEDRAVDDEPADENESMGIRDNDDDDDDVGGDADEMAHNQRDLSSIDRMLDEPESEPAPTGDRRRDGGSEARGEISTERRATGGPSDIQTLRRQKGRKSLSTSTDVKKSDQGVQLPFLDNGNKLIERSLALERDLLTSALEKSKVLRNDSVKKIEQEAANIAGLSILQKLGVNGPKANEKVTTIPVSIDTFSETKKQLFRSLQGVTEVVINSSSNHTHRNHFPYLAVELLSVSQKESAIIDGAHTSFAKLLQKGLRLALRDKKLPKGQSATPVLGQTTTVWSHYGGNRARRALQSCDTFKIALDFVLESSAAWPGESESQQADIEAIRPIEKLSITEDNSTGLEPNGNHNKNSNLSKRASQTSNTSLRCLEKQEAIELHKIAVCLLHLDALFRFESKDEVIEKTKEPKLTSEDNSANHTKDSERKDSEKMDTDDGSLPDVEGRRPNVAMYEDMSKRGKKLLRTVFGSASAAMDIDGKPEEHDGDLELVRRSAEEGKKELIATAKKGINQWTTLSEERSIASSIPKDALLMKCIALVKKWRYAEVGDALLAVLQLIGSLTLKWDIARTAVQNGLVTLLLSLPHLRPGQSKSTDLRVARGLTKTILRHILEDPKTLEEAMIAEFRGLLVQSQPRTRPPLSMKALIAATSPLAARNMQCYISAFAAAVRSADTMRRNEPRFRDVKMKTTQEMRDELAQRPHISTVVSALTQLIVEDQQNVPGRENSGLSQTSNRTMSNTKTSISKFALDLLSDFAEFSQVVAVAFIHTPSPANVVGSALDYVIQKVVPMRSPRLSKGSTGVPRLSLPRDDVAKSARGLFLALCSKTAGTHKEAVVSLAHAVKLEVGKKEVSAGSMSGFAQCVVPQMKLRVLREMLESDLPNDLARSLEKLDLSNDKSLDIATNILRSISLIGQASRYIARHGSSASEEVSFVTSNGRDGWASFRERDFMVL